MRRVRFHARPVTWLIAAGVGVAIAARQLDRRRGKAEGAAAAERRSQEDRRSGMDRRSGNGLPPDDAERRSGTERRSGVDRRDSTPST